MSEPPPSEGRLAALLGAVKNLTPANLLMLAGLLVIVVPVYVVYRALNDTSVMDRLMSSYQVIPNSSGCVLRTLKERGGPQAWSVSTGFAFHGAERWSINVILDQQPTDEALASHCATLKLIADDVLAAKQP